MKLNNVIVQQLVTEKSTALSALRKYIFRVALKASKGAIAAEVKRTYNVDVIAVQTIILPSKAKRIGRTRQFSKRANFKKAIVTLKEGQKIEAGATS